MQSIREALTVNMKQSWIGLQPHSLQNHPVSQIIQYFSLTRHFSLSSYIVFITSLLQSRDKSNFICPSREKKNHSRFNFAHFFQHRLLFCKTKHNVLQKSSNVPHNYLQNEEQSESTLINLHLKQKSASCY